VKKVRMDVGFFRQIGLVFAIVETALAAAHREGL
jgi:hypothetical protein